MQRGWYVTSTLVLLLIATGCAPHDKEIEDLQQKVQELENENNKLKLDLENIVRENQEFTYLEELSKREIEQYNMFLEDGNAAHLKDIRPEHMVLIFMNLVLKNEVNHIYALTYDEGNLPSKEVFISEYHDYLATYFEQECLKYRYYDSVSVREESQKDNLVTIDLTITFGNRSQTNVYALKEDQGLWKMAIYHLIESAKLEDL